MFAANIYAQRRADLRAQVGSGLILLPGNMDSPYNYKSNCYKFRQDSNFIYYFGIDLPEMVGVIDVDSGKDWLFGHEPTMDDTIWSGPLPALSDWGSRCKVPQVAALETLPTLLASAIDQGRRIHFCKPYRADIQLALASWLGFKPEAVASHFSIELTQAIVAQRSIKSDFEIDEIETAIAVAHEMHTTAMRMAKKVGRYEQEIASAIQAIAMREGGFVSFPVICSTHGETLHNNSYGNKLKKGRMLLVDSGAELPNYYCSDITRTSPVGGRFSEQQKDIYQIVLQANLKGIELARPGIEYRQVHLAACRVIVEGLKSLGLMKGSVDEALENGAHALFMPHGLGHMMGLDVHDMENLEERFVGYDQQTQRSTNIGQRSLRCGKKLQKGFVLTVEPGIYFIPALIEQWKAEKTFSKFINYKALEPYMDFGGVRIEDDIFIGSKGARVLGPAIPKSIEDVEETMNS